MNDVLLQTFKTRFTYYKLLRYSYPNDRWMAKLAVKRVEYEIVMTAKFDQVICLKGFEKLKYMFRRGNVF